MAHTAKVVITVRLSKCSVSKNEFSKKWSVLVVLTELVRTALICLLLIFFLLLTFSTKLVLTVVLILSTKLVRTVLILSDIVY